MAVFNLPAGLGNILHALGTEFIEFSERAGFMISALVGCRE